MHGIHLEEISPLLFSGIIAEGKSFYLIVWQNSAVKAPGPRHFFEQLFFITDLVPYSLLVSSGIPLLHDSTHDKCACTGTVHFSNYPVCGHTVVHDGLSPLVLLWSPVQHLPFVQSFFSVKLQILFIFSKSSLFLSLMFCVF